MMKKSNNHTRHFLRILVITLAFYMLSCSKDDADSAIPVTSVALDQNDFSLELGLETTLTATVSPANATDSNVTWSSSDETIATVDTNGKVTAVKVGQATITATAGGQSDTVTVTVSAVTIAVTSVALNQNDFSLDVGSETTLTATVSPANATDSNVTWSSSDETIATVDTNGKVTAVKVGQAVITATAGGQSDTITLTITMPPPSFQIVFAGGTLMPEAREDKSIVLVESKTMKLSTNPPTAVSWSSSDDSVLSISSDGVLTANTSGTGVKITATPTAGGNAVTLINPFAVQSLSDSGYNGEPFGTETDGYSTFSAFNVTSSPDQSENISDYSVNASQSRYALVPKEAERSLKVKKGGTISVSVSDLNWTQVAVWIDWNIDGFFYGNTDTIGAITDGSEEFYVVSSPLTETQSTVEISVPDIARVGTMRMRVQCTDTAKFYGNNPSNLGAGSYIRDFEVEITE